MILDDDGWLVAFENPSEPSSAKAQGCVIGSRVVAVRVSTHDATVVKTT